MDFHSTPCVFLHVSLVPHASTTNVVDGMWLYRLKRDKNGVVIHYKARFVTKGCRQQPVSLRIKQALRAWFERLSKALFDLGFKGSKTDPSLFIYSHRDTLLYILVYVDDIIVIGIEIVPHVSGILLSQKKYILELLQSVGLSNCNPMSSPMVTSSSLSLDDNTAFSNLVLPFKILLACYGKVTLILLFKLSQMLTGLEIQMIDGPRGDLLYILV
ncbi:retrovirus-related pol polyprotein from transposon TNT 1-94 [Tanacetum coccineum]